MKVEDLTTYEQYLEEAGGATVGWLARFGSGQAIWCGELSRAEFRLQSAEVRAALRDDFGWFLVEYDLTSPDMPLSRILGKAACESAGLELMQLIIHGRFCALSDIRQSTPTGIPAPVASKRVIGAISPIRP